MAPGARKTSIRPVTIVAVCIPMTPYVLDCHCIAGHSTSMWMCCHHVVFSVSSVCETAVTVA